MCPSIRQTHTGLFLVTLSIHSCVGSIPLNKEKCWLLHFIHLNFSQFEVPPVFMVPISCPNKNKQFECTISTNQIIECFSSWNEPSRIQTPGASPFAYCCIVEMNSSIVYSIFWMWVRRHEKWNWCQNFNKGLGLPSHCAAEQKWDHSLHQADEYENQRNLEQQNKCPCNQSPIKNGFYQYTL
jgi:hypothetical protein